MPKASSRLHLQSVGITGGNGSLREELAAFADTLGAEWLLREGVPFVHVPVASGNREEPLRDDRAITDTTSKKQCDKLASTAMGLKVKKSKNREH
ncbi:MAG: hypothetical protein KGQ87_09295 [Verrucomicrobia bacterium]|nr:hypothetical protein [Verrucomicrobiota bacterium]